MYISGERLRKERAAGRKECGNIWNKAVNRFQTEWTTHGNTDFGTKKFGVSKRRQSLFGSEISDQNNGDVITKPDEKSEKTSQKRRNGIRFRNRRPGTTFCIPEYCVWCRVSALHGSGSVILEISFCRKSL